MKRNLWRFFVPALAAVVFSTEVSAQAWTNLGAGLNGNAFALAFDPSGNLYAGGDFSRAGGTAANQIAKWNGREWEALPGERSDENIYELAFDIFGNLYAGGGSRIEKWNGIAWTNISSGMDWFVYCLACDNSGTLYAGGSFTQIGVVNANFIAKWDGKGWTNLASGMDFYVEALACDNAGNLYAGGWFTNAGGTAANRIAKWNGREWTNLGSGIKGTERPEDTPRTCVKALAFDPSGNLYAGGDFSRAGNTDAFAVAKWNGTQWSNLGQGMDFKVTALCCDKKGNLYAGGDFTKAGEVKANRIAAWNGKAWFNLGAGLNNSAESLACDSVNNIYCGGYFTEAGGREANHTAKWIPPKNYSPGPLIKANGRVDNLVLENGDSLSVTVELNPGEYSGENVDWWVVALSGQTWYYLDNLFRWVQFDGNLQSCRSAHSGALFYLPEREIMRINPPAGSYTVWFAVDYPMDGILNPNEAILIDSVNIQVR